MCIIYILTMFVYKLGYTGSDVIYWGSFDLVVHAIEHFHFGFVYGMGNFFSLF